MAGSKLNFAVAALLEIHRAGHDQSVDTREIAERTGLSRRYLEHILGLLREAGIVTSVRGKNGGYKLRLQPNELSLFDIWEAVREDITISIDGGALDNSHYLHGTQRITRSMWGELREGVVRHMQEQSLEALVLTELEDKEMYYI
jgi:Rrf2 family protein